MTNTLFMCLYYITHTMGARRYNNIIINNDNDNDIDNDNDNDNSNIM